MSATRPRTASPLVRLPALAFGLLACAGIAGSCADPIHDQAVAAQGPEVAGVDPSEFHRAGQQCTVCHEAAGPAKTTFRVAGTVFFGPAKLVGAEGVNVEMIDSLGSNYTAVTNCVGNFYVPPEAWDPAFPIFVQLQAPGAAGPLKMHSQISREGSCAGCHHDPSNYDSPGHVHASTQEPAQPFIDPNCPVNPVLVTAGAAVPGGQ